jgi:hypothetical protein
MGKKAIKIVMAASILIFCFGYVIDAADSPNERDPDLVAWWPFDEGAGTTAGDLSGNANNGTLKNGVTWVTEGKFGSALSFDGLDDYIEVMDDPSIDLNSEVTVEAWVNGIGAGFTAVQRTGNNVGSLPQLQVVGDEIHYVFTDGNDVWTARMNTDGTGWSATRRTSGGGPKIHGQFEVTKDTIWYVWRQQIDGYWQHYLGMMRRDGTGWSTIQMTNGDLNHY